MAIHIPLTTDGSAELFRKLVGGRTKLVAARLQRNANVVTNWQTPPPSEENPNSGGDYNPFDWIIRVLTSLGTEQAREGCDWIARQFGGRFVPANGGSGDGKLFRDLGDAQSHLKALQTEIRKGKSASPAVLRAHLDEVFVIITSNTATAEVSHDHDDNS